MPLILFSWFVKSELFNEYCGSNIGDDLYKRNTDRALESVLPFGYIERATDNQSSVAYVKGNQFVVTENLSKSFEQWMNE